MRTFLLGLFLGALSGGLTHMGTGHQQFAAAVGILVAIATWFGVACIVVARDTSRSGATSTTGCPGDPARRVRAAGYLALTLGLSLVTAVACWLTLWSVLFGALLAVAVWLSGGEEWHGATPLVPRATEPPPNSGPRTGRDENDHVDGRIHVHRLRRHHQCAGYRGTRRRLGVGGTRRSPGNDRPRKDGHPQLASP